MKSLHVVLSTFTIPQIVNTNLIEIQK